MKYRIKYALGGGFGGVENANWEVIEAENIEEAEDIAYNYARYEYESYEGLHGLRSISDIMEEDDYDEDIAIEIYNEEVESWVEYKVEPVIEGEEK